MNKRCPVCWKELGPTGADATLFTAAGRPIVAVHRGKCAMAFKAGVHTAGRALLGAARNYLKRRRPGLVRLVEDIAKARRGAA